MNETEVGKLLRYVFNRPARVTVLVCLCGKTADLKKSLKAWNGWQCLPFAVCPECLAGGRYRGAYHGVANDWGEVVTR